MDSVGQQVQTAEVLRAGSAALAKPTHIVEGRFPWQNSGLMSFCTKCGAENPADGEFCYKCGRPLFSSLPDPAKPEATPAKTLLPGSSKQLSGIGGWLLLLCFSLAVGGPLGFLYQTVVLLERGVTPLSVFISAIMLSIGIFSFVCGLKLWKEDRRAVKLTKTFFYVMMTFSLLIALAGFALLMTMPTSTAKNEGDPLFVAGVQAFLIQIAWLLYLHKSVRVKNTYQLSA